MQTTYHYILILKMHPTSRLLAGGVLKRTSYYNPDYSQSAALIRARRPYLVKNAITGICIFGFAVGVFAFTLRAVGQERFDDVVVPDAPPPNTRNAVVTGSQS